MRGNLIPHLVIFTLELLLHEGNSLKLPRADLSQFRCKIAPVASNQCPEETKVAPVCHFQNVSFSYGTLKENNWLARAFLPPASRPNLALQNVDFTIERGKMVAFTGLSGSGKSTVLKICLSKLTPQGGSVQMRSSLVRFLDNDALDESNVRIQKAGSYAKALASLSLEESQIQKLASLVGVAARDAPWQSLSDDSRLTLALCFSVAACFLPVESGGQATKIKDGSDSPFLLFDELFDNCSLDYQVGTQRVLRAACMELGITVIHATHSLRLARMADLVVFMNGGRLIQFVPPEESTFLKWKTNSGSRVWTP